SDCVCAQRSAWLDGICLIFFFFFASSVEKGIFGIPGGQGRTDNFDNSSTARGPGSAVGPIKCPWYLFIGFFGCVLSVGKETGAP
ncbi:unnamed protein product, partial [Staurois parvus]